MSKNNSVLKWTKTRFKELFPGVVPLFVIAHLLHHIPGFIIQPVAPSIRDQFGLDYTQVGFLSSAYNLAYGVSNLPAGWAADRIGSRIIIALGVSGVAIFGIFIGLSPSYLMMILAFVFMGVLGGGYHPSASPLLSDVSAGEQRGRILGMHQVGGTLANFITPLLATGIAVALTWRGAYIVLSAPIVAFGIFLFVYLKRRHLGDTKQRVSQQSFSIHINPPGYLRRMAAAITIGAAVQVFVFSTLTFVPLLVVDGFKGSEAAGAAFLSLAHFAGLWAGPVGGHMSDRFGKTPLLIGAGLAVGPLLFLLGTGFHWWLLPIVLIGLGTCMYVAMPVSESYVISNASQHNRSTLLGVYYFVSRGGPGLLTPAIGNLIDKFNFTRAFAIEGAVIVVVVIVCSLILRGKPGDDSPIDSA